jgi:hypothetical protein
MKLPQPTLIKLPLANQSPIHFVNEISSLLTPSECSTLINQCTPFLIPVSGAYSNRQRRIFEDEDLAILLWTRLESFYNGMKITDEEAQTWTAHSLNPVFRFASYGGGDGFAPHFDGRRLVQVDLQSFLTVNIYLNTVPESAGGATRVLSSPSSPNFSANEKFEVLGSCQPVQGTAAVFRDSLFHDGEVLREGKKFLLRTDIVFKRDKPFDFERMYGELNKEERGRKAMDLAVEFEDGGNMDEAYLWYRKAFKLYPELEKGG